MQMYPIALIVIIWPVVRHRGTIKSVLSLESP